MSETQHIILKSDRRGRLRFSPEQRSTMLAAYDTSGLSGPKFAQLHGINYQTFAGWLQRRKRRPNSPAESASTAAGLFTLIEAVANPGSFSSRAGLEIMLPGGVRLLVDSAASVSLAAALLRQLQSPLPC